MTPLQQIEAECFDGFDALMTADTPTRTCKREIARIATAFKSTFDARIGIIADLASKGKFGEAWDEADRIDQEGRRLSHDVQKAIKTFEREINR